MSDTTSHRLRIFVHNTDNNQGVMHSTLDTASGRADLVLIQEPLIYYPGYFTIQHPSFRLIMPPQDSRTPNMCPCLCLNLNQRPQGGITP